MSFVSRGRHGHSGIAHCVGSGERQKLDDTQVSVGTTLLGPIHGYMGSSNPGLPQISGTSLNRT